MLFISGIGTFGIESLIANHEITGQSAFTVSSMKSEIYIVMQTVSFKPKLGINNKQNKSSKAPNQATKHHFFSQGYSFMFI